jgi:hypothetical protein
MDNITSPNTYFNALKSKPLRNVEITGSARRKALSDQKGKCARCNKELKPYYFNYVRDPQTKEYSVVCSNCLIPINKR